MNNATVSIVSEILLTKSAIFEMNFKNKSDVLTTKEVEHVMQALNVYFDTHEVDYINFDVIKNCHVFYVITDRNKRDDVIQNLYDINLFY